MILQGYQMPHQMGATTVKTTKALIYEVST